MKKIPSLLLFLFAGGLPLIAQQKPVKTAEEIKMMLCHTWKSAYMEAKGKKRFSMDDINSRSVLIFNSDQTLITKYWPGGKERADQDRWSYDQQLKTVSVDEGNRVTLFKIIKITETDLVFGMDWNGMKGNMIFKRAD